MERDEAKPGRRVRAVIGDTEYDGVIHRVGASGFRSLRDMARVTFRDNPEVGARWVPIKDLRRETR
jgi:hypothetical protein